MSRMSDMTESGSDISIRAEKRVLDALAMWAKRERVIARDCLNPRTDAAQIEMHKVAAELYEALAKAAPGIWHDRDRLIADAKNAVKEADHG